MQALYQKVIEVQDELMDRFVRFLGLLSDEEDCVPADFAESPGGD